MKVSHNLLDNVKRGYGDLTPVTIINEICK